MNEPEVSVVIPFYNEEGNVLPLFEELLPVLRGMERSFEVVAVDDGSRDRTGDELNSVARLHREVRHLRFPSNRGQSAAFKAGFEAARGRFIVTMDGDLQIDPADLPPMLDLLEREGVDLVHGWRRERRDPFLKRVSTRIANAVRNRLTGERIHDTGCPLKVFRREALEELPPFDGMHRFFITLAHMRGFRSREMVVRHRHRRSGESKYGIRNRVFRALRDCLVVRWMQKRYVRSDAEELGPVRTSSEEKVTR